MGECKGFDNPSVSSLAIIPARGGSKGLARKCSLPVAGVPLLARAVKAALSAKSVGRVVVSTDDPEFAELAKANGAEVPFLRPAELATDSSPIVDAVVHLLKFLKHNEGFSPEFIVLLQPTAPFVLGIDIDSAFKTMTASGADAAVSVCQSEIKPDWLRRTGPGGWLEPVFKLDSAQHTPRQLMPATYRLNGAIYWIKAGILLERKTFIPERTVHFEMPSERSVDIDSELDLKYANFIAKELNLD